jgi:hypothetical protein
VRCPKPSFISVHDDVALNRLAQRITTTLLWAS